MSSKKEKVNSSAQIAVVGIGCRFPGQADSPEKFWKLLRDEKETITEVPSSRWALGDYYDPNPDAPGKMYTKWGSFLSEDISQFDAKFFEMSQTEAASTDPQQRLILEVTWEAFENAFIKPSKLEKERVAVFTGIFTHDYFDFFLKFPELANAFSNLGGIGASIAGRISHFFDFQGPSLSVDTASSASLVAVHLACKSLQTGESDLAVAGGVNLMINPETTIGFCKTGSMASDGRCKAFDESANGYVRGEGCGVLLLKRLEDAIKDGDRIHGVIVGSAVNQDGNSSSLMTPSEKAQEKLLTKALLVSEVKPSRVGYIEAHGTGTPVGDPIEIGAILAAYKNHRGADQPLVVGSVKTNIGHLESAAGIAGLVKVLMAIKHGEIPKHLNLNQINPRLPQGQFPIVIPRTLMKWPTNGPRVAGVSSFGMSGTNAHVLVQQAPQAGPMQVSSTLEKSEILTFSAKDPESLKQLAGRYIQLLKTHPSESFGDICYSAATGRTQFRHRMALLAKAPDEAISKLESLIAARKVSGAFSGVLSGHGADSEFPVAFLYSGQGVQYCGMGQQLYQAEPVFRASLDQCAEVIKNYWDKPLLEVLFNDENLLNQTAYTQPSIFCIQFALTQLWKSWGIQPRVVMGHSVGEFAAACAAEVFSMADGLKLIIQRAALMQKMTGLGVMYSLNVSAEKAEAALSEFKEKVSIAAINGPQSTVIAGESAYVEAIVKRLKDSGAKATQLNVSVAAHSPQMEIILDEFEVLASTVQFSRPKIHFISNVLGTLVDEQVCHPGYWRNHIRQPVRFFHGIQAMASLGLKGFIEIGPNTSVLGMAQLCTTPEMSTDIFWIPSMRKDRDDVEQISESLAHLQVKGANVDWTQYFLNEPRRKVDLPLYPFNRKAYWVDSSQIKPVVSSNVTELKVVAPEMAEQPIPSLSEVKPYQKILLSQPGERKEVLTYLVKKEISQQLNLADVSEVISTRPLGSQGIDSLRAVELRKYILETFENKITVPPTVVLDYPTVDLLVEYILSKFPDSVGEASPTGNAAVTDSTIDQLANDLHELFTDSDDFSREIEDLLGGAKKSG